MSRTDYTNWLGPLDGNTHSWVIASNNYPMKKMKNANENNRIKVGKNINGCAKVIFLESSSNAHVHPFKHLSKFLFISLGVKF